jgi:hypothetical protein
MPLKYNIMVDSGAYSEFTKGPGGSHRPIKLRDYIAFIKEN